MDDVLADLADQHAELDGILAGLSEDDWARASACEGWSVADVVVHLTQSDEGAVASVEGRLPEGGLGGQDADVDDWAERMVVEARVHRGVRCSRRGGRPRPRSGPPWRRPTCRRGSLGDRAAVGPHPGHHPAGRVLDPHR